MKKTIQRPQTAQISRRGKRILKLPRLETMFEDEGDPLEDVDYNPNDLEASATNEMTEIVRQIKEQKKALQDRFRVARDPDYWLALCFQSHEQRDEFLQKSGWAAPDTKYLNGLEIAARLGVSVSPIEIKPLPLRGKPKKYQGKEVM
jgi:hypothetical protein